MKTFFKWGVMALGCMACAGGLYSTCAADQSSFLNVTATTAASSGSSASQVGVNAEFVPAATYTVEHEPMTLSKPQAAPAAFPDINHIVTREAHVTIGGLPGETVFVTCDVSNNKNAQKSIRDCGGAPTVEQRMIMSGQQLDDGVLLTNDLLPNNSNKSESTVTFEVSYL